MIWKTNTTVEIVNQSSSHCMPGFLGIEITEIGADFLLAKMPVDERTTQPFGILHGGASVVLSESLGSVASTLCIDLAKNAIVGVEVNANHLRPVPKGKWVYARVSPIKIGRRLHVWNTEITNEEGKLVCTSRLTVAVIEQVNS